MYHYRKRRKRPRPRPAAQVEADLARARADLDKYETWGRHVEARSAEEKRSLAPIREAIRQLRDDPSSYQPLRLLDIFRSRSLTTEAQEKLSKLEAELARQANVLDARFPPMSAFPFPNNRNFYPDYSSRVRELYSSRVRELERELEKGRELEAKQRTAAAKRAQVAGALGKTRDLAARIKAKLPRDHPCPYCEGPLGDVPHADHIYPVSKGGQSRLENMVYVCTTCNERKRDFTLAVFAEKHRLDRAAIEGRLRRLRKEF